MFFNKVHRLVEFAILLVFVETTDLVSDVLTIHGADCCTGYGWGQTTGNISGMCGAAVTLIIDCMANFVRHDKIAVLLVNVHHVSATVDFVGPRNVVWSCCFAASKTVMSDLIDFDFANVGKALDMSGGLFGCHLVATIGIQNLLHWQPTELGRSGTQGRCTDRWCKDVFQVGIAPISTVFFIFPNAFLGFVVVDQAGFLFDKRGNNFTGCFHSQ